MAQIHAIVTFIEKEIFYDPRKQPESVLSILSEPGLDVSSDWDPFIHYIGLRVLGGCMCLIRELSPIGVNESGLSVKCGLYMVDTQGAIFHTDENLTSFP